MLYKMFYFFEKHLKTVNSLLQDIFQKPCLLTLLFFALKVSKTFFQSLACLLYSTFLQKFIKTFYKPLALKVSKTFLKSLALKVYKTFINTGAWAQPHALK